MAIERLSVYLLASPSSFWAVCYKWGMPKSVVVLRTGGVFNSCNRWQGALVIWADGGTRRACTFSDSRSKGYVGGFTRGQGLWLPDLSFTAHPQMIGTLTFSGHARYDQTGHSVICRRDDVYVCWRGWEERDYRLYRYSKRCFVVRIKICPFHGNRVCEQVIIGVLSRRHSEGGRPWYTSAFLVAPEILGRPIRGRRLSGQA
jgi:hypothetical protein